MDGALEHTTDQNIMRAFETVKHGPVLRQDDILCSHVIQDWHLDETLISLILLIINHGNKSKSSAILECETIAIHVHTLGAYHRDMQGSLDSFQGDSVNGQEPLDIGRLHQREESARLGKSFERDVCQKKLFHLTVFDGRI
jgi:hypothetical protein